jgi:hypothetical protein
MYASFVVTGLKKKNNTDLKMAKSPKSTESSFLEVEIRGKLQGIFHNYIYHIVSNKFGWLFAPIKNWLTTNKVKLYAHFASGVAAGKHFWLHSYTDPDKW